MFKVSVIIANALDPDSQSRLYDNQHRTANTACNTAQASAAYKYSTSLTSLNIKFINHTDKIA